MSLTGITKGRVKRPLFVTIYGPDGVGKSTFGAEAPNPIFLGPEKGSENLDVVRYSDLTTFSQIHDKVRGELLTADHDRKTLVIDSLDWIEPLLHAEICALDGSATIGAAMGGYNKGLQYATRRWSEFIADLEKLRDKRGMNIIAIAHAQSKSVNDPMHAAPYDRWQLKLDDRASALWREACGALLFVTYEVFVKKEKSEKKGRAIGEDKRVLFTSRRPAFDAKNRFGLPFQLPFEIGYAWQSFTDAVEKGQPDSLEAVQGEIAELLALAAPDVKIKMEKAITEAAGDLAKLTRIRNYARTVVGGEA